MRTPPLGLALVVLACPAAAQTWTAGPSFPSDPVARLDTVGVVHQGTLYAIGGSPWVGTGPDAAVHSLASGATSWTATRELEGPVVHQGAGVDALGQLIVFGGVDAIDPEGDEGKVFLYDPIEGQKGGIAQRSGSAPAALFAWATDDVGRIYSIGGGDGEGATAGTPNSTWVERYDGALDVWSPVAPLPSGLADAAAVNDGRGRILVLGGFVAAGAVRTTDVVAYDVATDTWSSTDVPDMPVALAGLRAVLGSDERVYAVGGTDASGVRAEVWVLDLATNTWSQGPSLATPRQRFAAALADDDHIYVCGGDDGAGGTATVEKLYTPICPVFATGPADANAWVGMRAELTATPTGGAPFTYRWRKDGVDLYDGPAAGGGSIAGAAAALLTIDPVGPADAGSYSLVATNSCGSDESATAYLTVRTPPTVGSSWVVTNLHPPGALGSAAYAVDGVEIGGSATYPDATYGSLEHPMLYTSGGGTPLDLTPAGSVGGGVLAVANGVQAGWYWWPYWTPYGTAYHKKACTWGGTAASHFHINPTGWEYGSVSDTDGTSFVGTMRRNDAATTSDGAFWPGSSSYSVILTPAVAWGSGTTALDGGDQFGNVNLGFGVVHAAKWSGSSASFVDINPVGSSWSYVLGAGGGQQVGRATIGGTNGAALWTGTPESFRNLHPAGMSSSELYDAEGGIQVGWVTGPGINHAALFAGSSSSFVDLHLLLPPNYVSSFARGVDVGPGGSITVVGTAYDSTAGRNEAFEWRVDGDLLYADTGTLSEAIGGVQNLTLATTPAHASKLYVLLGSASGTEPGTPYAGLVVPLNLDAYTLFTLRNANLPPFVSTFGVLDATGSALASIAVPAGSGLAPLPLTLHHAALVMDPLLASVELASNAVGLVVVP